MKKLFLAIALMMGFVAANAQATLQGSKPLDNISITLKGGAVSPFQHYAFFKSARGEFGIELRKQITPVFGLGVEGEWTINTSSWTKNPAGIWGPHSANILDHQLIGPFAAINLSNLFGGYKGTPRLVEAEAVMGLGWWHGYKHDKGIDLSDENSWYTKFGMNINFNLGSAKEWTVALKPAVVWDMNGDVAVKDINGLPTGTVVPDRKWVNKQSSRFNANHAMVEMQVGLTYHFANSNGTHHFALCDKKYTQADVDALNEEINRLRNRAPEVKVVEKVVEKIVEKPVETIISKTGESLESNVFFAQGKSVITAAQMPNVERVATFLKNHKDATVTIKGYASPEGSKEINERLAKARAEAVKNMLINKYKVKASRISAEGLGVGDMFSEPDWNRVSVCTIFTQDVK